MTEDERAIRGVVDSWMRASESGNLQTVLSLMTDDVVFMVPGREPFGKQEFATAAELMKGTRMQGVSEIRELQVLGDWAYLRNHIRLTMTSPAGAPIRRSGYTLTIMRKGDDGRWRLARDANLVSKDEESLGCSSRAVGWARPLRRSVHLFDDGTGSRPPWSLRRLCLHPIVTVRAEPSTPQ